MEENLKKEIENRALSQLIEESAKGNVENVSTQIVEYDGNKYEVCLEKVSVQDTWISTTINILSN